MTSSVEKLIQSIDNIFDALTAVEKLGNITDMPLEKEHGLRFVPADYSKGLHLAVKNLFYQYQGKNKHALSNVSFTLNPTESLCVTGSNGSGKNTLMRVLSGMLTDYHGGILFNGISLKDLNVVNLRSFIELNTSMDDIFEGTILQNITMGREEVSLSDLEWVLSVLNLNEAIARLPEGLSSTMLPGGYSFSESFITKIALARCLVTRPRILMLDDTLQNLPQEEREKLIQLLIDKDNQWSLIIMSNDPYIMNACDQVMVMDEGEVLLLGPYEEIRQNAGFDSVSLAVRT